ncbi:MAG: peptide ABC transporter substrate-binding protein [Cardiobacteriaceae bacterium]|nr:peptide ABC transporter substrate-binding protein [Cardiobacteriaceae bacterium]
MTKSINSLLFSLLLASNTLYAQNILNKGNASEPSTMDPQLAQGTAEMDILRDMFDGLVDEDPAANLIAGAAEKWDISEDGKVYTFHLRPHTWSDGKPVTAHDFVYAWQRAVNPEVGSKYSFFLYPVVNAKEITEGKAKVEELGIKALDDKTLQVTLNHATPYFLGMLVNAVTYPVPKHVVEQYGADWAKEGKIIGNGAFVMEKWVPQSHVALKKSTSYFNADKVKLDGVVYHVSEDNASELKRYRAGEIDLTATVPHNELSWIKENLKDELKNYNQLGVQYFGFNLTKPPFKDQPKLREALSLAIDRDKIVKYVTGGDEQVAYSYVVHGVANYQPYVPEYAKWSQEERVKAAQKAYEEAGYSKDKPLKVELLYNTNENNKKLAIAIAAMWKESLGVEAELVNKEWKAYLSDRRSYNTQVFRSSWIGDYDDANTFLEMFVSGGGSNTIGLNDEAYDALLQKAAAELDLNKRAEILQQAEKHLMDLHGVMPIYYFSAKRLVKPYVKGYELNLMDHWQSKYLSIEK